MIADQASALRELVMQTPTGRRARFIAITSGKGGVGKTSVAVNLAVRLTAMGRQTVLLDADLGTANADILCNLPVTSSLAHVVAGRRTLGETMIEVPGGFRLIPGASGLAQMAALGEYERSRLVGQMGDLEQAADVVLVDTGAGISPNVLGFAVSVDQLLVVTTPEPTAMTDAYATIKTVHRHRDDCDVAILVNFVHGESEGRAVFEKIEGVCRRFLKLNVSFAGHLVHDRRVAMGVRRRRPFILDAPQCGASVCIGRLAHRMDRHATEPNGDGLLRRMVQWFKN